MTRSIVDDLMERRAALVAEAEDIARRAVAHKRDLSVTEQTKFDGLLAEARKVESRAAELREGEQRVHELGESFRRVTGQPYRAQPTRGELGEFLREARQGDAFELRPPVPGAEQRAVGRVAAGETRAMSATGGVGPDGVYGQLWEYAVAQSQIVAAGATVVNTTDGNSLPFPVATVHAQTSDTVTAANAALALSDATLTTVSNTVSKYDYLTLVPTELLQDASFDLEGYVARAAGRELGRRIGKVASTALVAGYTTVGVTGPVGTTTTFGNAATAGMGSDIFVNIFHSVLPEYRQLGSSWLMADATLGVARNVKSGTTGTPILVDPIMGGSPQILGKPVFIDPNLPTPAANAKTIYFGDFASLIIRIAGGIRFERSDQYAFGNDQVAFRAIVRVGASVLDPNAVKFFQHSAT